MPNIIFFVRLAEQRLSQGGHRRLHSRFLRGHLYKMKPEMKVLLLVVLSDLVLPKIGFNQFRELRLHCKDISLKTIVSSSVGLVHSRLPQEGFRRYRVYLMQSHVRVVERRLYFRETRLE